MLRFIHCADLHIGTPFKGVADSFGTNSGDFKELLSSPEKAFNRIIDTALAEKVDFVLFAGDIMDSVNVSWRSISVFDQGIKKLKDADIPSLVIAGNHDALPCNALEQACRNAVLFPADEVKYHEIPGKALIAGISFSFANAKVNLAKKFKRQDSDLFQIALYHGNIGGQAAYDNYSPASIGDLAEANMDYWALGHIHEKAMLSEKNPVILYSGAPLSRHVNEKSPKGFHLIKVDDFKNVKTNFIPCGVLGFFREEISLHDTANMEELKSKCLEKISAVIAEQKLEKYFIELVLRGNTVLDKELRYQNENDLISLLANSLPSNVRLTSINVRTNRNIDKNDFCNSNIFASDLHKTFEKEKSENFPTLEEEITALKRTYGNLFDIEDFSLQDTADDAENEIIRMLMEDSI